MKQKLILLLVVALAPLTASAQNIGKCGWGSKLFDKQKGIAPQVLAATTNGTSGNQTFAISSGTSGCTQDGVVRSSWKTAMFIGSNMDKLAKDMSSGEGETLDSLAFLLGVEDNDKDLFKSALRSNFSSIFSTPETSSEEVQLAIRQVLAADVRLADYATFV